MAFMGLDLRLGQLCERVLLAWSPPMCSIAALITPTLLP